MARGYDLLGNIAIIEEESRADERKKAKELLSTHKQISTVLAKAGAVTGIYRIRKVRYVAGKKNYIADYRENNCLFRFDVRKTFFSNRLSFERTRILGLVKPEEDVMVMFAGVGPFAIEIAKSQRKSTVRCIELNRDAYNYLLENVRLNKVKNVTAQCGDVKKLSKKNEGFADRVVMPMPKTSLSFLDDALRVSKRKSVIHLYTFGPAESVVKNTKKAIREHAKKNRYSVKFLSDRVVRPYSAMETEIVLDFTVIKK
ncbi:MAG: tRNA (guanine-N1)-methyltransferase [Candidatus Micrarchaeota archaeon]|nr:tRNA (guanine-N1)-methyltransferase [Candidatus Micrarchaeota archaeon]